ACLSRSVSYLATISYLFLLSLHVALPISRFVRSKILCACSSPILNFSVSSSIVKLKLSLYTKPSEPVLYGGSMYIHRPTIQYRRSEEHTSELQSRFDLVCRLLLENKKNC